MDLLLIHSKFTDLDPDEVFKAVGRFVAIVDCFTILDDYQIQRSFECYNESKGIIRWKKYGSRGKEREVSVAVLPRSKDGLR